MSGTKRTIGLFTAISIVVGIVIGASIFSLTPILVGMTGPSAIFAQIISVIPVLFSIIFLVQLAGVLPVTGANYIAINRYLSPGWGFATSFTMVIGIVAIICLDAYSAAAFLQTFLPDIDLILTSLIIIFAFGVINFFGIKLMSVIQTLMFIFLLVSMLIIGFGGLPTLDPANLNPMFPNGTGQFFIVVGISSFSWIGILTVANFSGEIKNPKKNLPRAIIISVIILIVLYVLVTLSIAGNLDWRNPDNAVPTGAIIAGQRFLPPTLLSIITVGAILAIFTTISGLMMIAVREMSTWGAQKVAPAIVNKKDKKGTPYVSVIIFTAACCLGMMIGAKLEDYATMVVFPYMLLQVSGAIAMYRMTKKDKETYQNAPIKVPKGMLLFSVIGNVLTCGIVIAFAFIASATCAYIAAGCYAIGILYWIFRGAYLKKKGLSLKKEAETLGADTLAEIEAGKASIAEG